MKPLGKKPMKPLHRLIEAVSYYAKKDREAKASQNYAKEALIKVSASREVK